jgi:hypothetical protein
MSGNSPEVDTQEQAMKWWIRSILLIIGLVLLYVMVTTGLSGIQATASAFTTGGDTTDNGLGLVIGIPMLLIAAAAGFGAGTTLLLAIRGRRP